MNYENGIDNGVKQYLNDLKDVKPLSKAEEQELMRRYKIENDLNARNKLIKSNLKYACKLANPYRGIGGITYAELISEANSGLLKAIDKFDMNQDIKLISYAKWWIISAMQEAVAARTKTPYSELPSDNMSFEIEEDDVSYEKRNYTTEDGFIIEEETQEEENEKKLLAESLLSTLTERECDMIKMYFGMNEYKEHTLDKIGKKYNLTKERVRQIIENAEKKMKSHAMLIENQYIVR